MSVLSYVETISPSNQQEECAKFEIPVEHECFTLLDVMDVGVEYTLSFWIKSDDDNVLSINGVSITTTSTWTRYASTFTADSNDLIIDFSSIGNYYIYQTQLEIGNVVTDYSPAPEDVEEAINEAAQSATNAQQTADGVAEQIIRAESQIQQLADSIAMMVRSGTAGSLVKQDANGLYYFDISDIETNISKNGNNISDLEGIVLKANGQIDILQSTAGALQKRTEYVRSYTDENDQPCLELGEADSSFKVYLTNTELRFVDGSSVPAYMSNQKLYIEKAEVTNELQFGGFVWEKRANGNMGLVWKGVGT